MELLALTRLILCSRLFHSVVENLVVQGIIIKGMVTTPKWNTVGIDRQRQEKLGRCLI